MSPEPGTVEQAVTRALRDNLDALQRTANELQQAINDLVSACASNRPTNAIPPMIRAQTAAASLAAALDVLARFTAAAAQPAARGAEAPAMNVVSMPAPAPVAQPAPVPQTPEPMAAYPTTLAVPVSGAPVEELPEVRAEPVAEEEPTAEIPAVKTEAAPEAFDVSALSSEVQEIHRRASRAAKVSMQDIKLLKPKELKLAKENRDICIRLREDLDKARKEYDRRFKAILDHPVDYFYQWAVDILAEGNPELLGEYPYPSPVLRR